MDCVKNAIPVIVFYSFFVYHILTYVLRIALNYYHFSINEFHRIPHIVSFIGPLVCQYQAWSLLSLLLISRVVGVYCVIVLVILPFNRDGIWMSFFFGSILFLLITYFGKEALWRDLMNGIIVATYLLTVVPFVWKK